MTAFLKVTDVFRCHGEAWAAAIKVRTQRPEPKDASHQPDFVPAMVVAESGPTPYPVAPASSGGAIEIEFVAGVRMRITAAVDAATLKAAVAALADGRQR